jgi:hypothetical protein
VVAQGINPLNGCQLLVRSDMSLATLHTTLQMVFAWSDVHLHGFCLHGMEYGSARLGGPSNEDCCVDRQQIDNAYFCNRTAHSFPLRRSMRTRQICTDPNPADPASNIVRP